MIGWVGALLDRVCAVIGAVIFAQMPLFIQQYSQQLIGRAAELRLQVDAMRQSASLSGKTLDQLIAKFLANSDVDVARQGKLMEELVARWTSLNDSLVALQTSNVFERPFVFLANLNSETFMSTIHNFSLGIPLTIEGGVYAFIGIILGYSLFTGLRKLFRALFFRSSKVLI